MITPLNIEHLSCLVARIEGDLPPEWNGHLSAVVQKQVSSIHGYIGKAGFGFMKPALRHLKAGLSNSRHCWQGADSCFGFVPMSAQDLFWHDPAHVSCLVEEIVW